MIDDCDFDHPIMLMTMTMTNHFDHYNDDHHYYATRVDIWRDRWDRRSRNFFCELRKFLGKQCKMLYNFTPKLRKFTHFA